MENQPGITFAIYVSGLIFKEIDKQLLSPKERLDLDLWRQSSEDRDEIFQQLQNRQDIVRELKFLNEKYNPDETIKRVFQILELDRPTLSNKTHISSILRRSLTVSNTHRNSGW